MDERDLISERHRTLFRVGLLALAAVQAVNGLHALLAPRSFYDDFPFGRAWVAALPDYSEHLVRDVGGLFLGTAIVLGAAGLFLGRRLVGVALVSFLAFSVPHAAYHLLNLGPYEAADAIANVLTLGATVVIPGGLLVLLVRDRGGPAPPAGRAGEPPAGWRIEPVGESTRNPLVRFAYRGSRKRAGGEVMDPMRVFAHHPRLMIGYSLFELATEGADRLDDRIKYLAVLRAGMLCGCEWCLDYGSAVATAHQLAEDDLRALPDYRRSDRFDETERLVLDYASAMSRTPCDVPGELFAALRESFDEGQLVELTSLIALENYRARFNWAFGLAGQGFTEGSYCVRPVAQDGGSAPAAAPGR
jgi:alkylhydroperoxidase family enzyme